MRDIYAKREGKQQQNLKFNFDLAGAQPKAELSAKTTGVVFLSDDGTRLLQLANDGFTLNFLHPYSDGDRLLKDARRAWDLYATVAKPARTLRLALRFINRMHLADEEIDFDDYFSAAPRIPDGLPQTLANYFSRVTIANAELKAFAAVAQAFNGERKDEGFEVVLDIDVFTERHYDPTDPEIWQTFSQLRAFKNDIFFRHVTDRLLEKYS